MAFDPITAGIDFGKELVGFIGKKFLRDKMSEKELADVEQAAQSWVVEQAHKEDSTFRQFVVEYEGAAKDYANVPIVGPAILLLRGFIRPAFTMVVGYIDYLYFCLPIEKAQAYFSDDQASLLKIINIIILTFWFGERAITNSGIIDKILQYKRGNGAG